MIFSGRRIVCTYRNINFINCIILNTCGGGGDVAVVSVLFKWQMTRVLLKYPQCLQVMYFSLDQLSNFRFVWHSYLWSIHMMNLTEWY